MGSESFLVFRPATRQGGYVVGRNGVRPLRSSASLIVPGRSLQPVYKSQRCSATSGQGDPHAASRPSKSALQRRNKAWLQEELSRRGVANLGGTKAVLAERLYEEWGRTAQTDDSTGDDSVEAGSHPPTPPETDSAVKHDKALATSAGDSVATEPVAFKGRDDGSAPGQRKQSKRGKRGDRLASKVSERSGKAVGGDGKAEDEDMLHVRDASRGVMPTAAAKPDTGEQPPAVRLNESKLMADLQEMKVADLQSELVALGLPKSGKKATLIQRLAQAKLGRGTEEPIVWHEQRARNHSKPTSRDVTKSPSPDLKQGSSRSKAATPDRSSPRSSLEKPAPRSEQLTDHSAVDAVKGTHNINRQSEKSAKKEPVRADTSRSSVAKVASGKEQMSSDNQKRETVPSSSDQALPDHRASTVDVESALREKIAMLQTEVTKREKTLKILQDKLQSAKEAETVDQAMLAKMRMTVSDMEEQRQRWQAFLQSSRASIVKTTADDIRVNIRPQLEEQLSDLEAMAQDLEGEMQVKDDVVQRLTESLNRSLGSSVPVDQDVGGFSSMPGYSASASPAHDASSEEMGLKRKEQRGNAGGIGVALAAGVISVLKGFSIFQSFNKKEEGGGAEETRTEETKGNEEK